MVAPRKLRAQGWPLWIAKRDERWKEPRPVEWSEGRFGWEDEFGRGNGRGDGHLRQAWAMGKTKILCGLVESPW